MRALAWEGRLLVVGFASGEIPAIPANRLLLKRATAIGVYWNHDRDAGMLDRVVPSPHGASLKAGAFARISAVRLPSRSCRTALAALADRRPQAKSLSLCR